MALDSKRFFPSADSKAGTLPMGNLARYATVLFVSPKTKSGGSETTRTFAPLNSAATRALYALNERRKLKYEASGTKRILVSDC